MLVFDAPAVVRRTNRFIRVLKVAQIHSSSHIVLLKAGDEEKSTDEERKFAIDALVAIAMEVVGVNMLESFGKRLAAQLVESVFQSNVSKIG